MSGRPQEEKQYQTADSAPKEISAEAQPPTQQFNTKADTGNGMEEIFTKKNARRLLQGSSWQTQQKCRKKSEGRKNNVPDSERQQLSQRARTTTDSRQISRGIHTTLLPRTLMFRSLLQVDRKS
ncbi:hypothetical protein EAF04_005812 [Stromatinia cepivora]|nr:hypothetical protein EAF04_005812 [Stromatinia cepivora]